MLLRWQDSGVVRDIVFLLHKRYLRPLSPHTLPVAQFKLPSRGTDHRYVLNNPVSFQLHFSKPPTPNQSQPSRFTMHPTTLLALFSSLAGAAELAQHVPQDFSKRSAISSGGWALTSGGLCPQGSAKCSYFCCPGSLPCQATPGGIRSNACCHNSPPTPIPSSSSLHFPFISPPYAFFLRGRPS